MSRIVVVGGLNMDLHLFGVEHSVSSTPTVAKHYHAEPGGKGANVARAAARLGAEVSLVGRIGDDEFGRHCIDVVSDDGVDTRSVALTPHQPTGFVAIELREGKHTSLLFAAGANDDLTWEDIEPAVRDLGPDDIVIAQAEMPPVPLSELAAWLAGNGATLFLDPTPPERVDADLIAAAEVITPNDAEAAALVGRTEGSPMVAALAARDLLQMGARRALIKTGETGSLLVDASGMQVIPTIQIEPLDETGAGDVFLASLAVARSEAVEWEEAARFANVAAALSVAATGLMLPERKAVEAALALLD